jgi:hypothetical protein
VQKRPNRLYIGHFRVHSRCGKLVENMPETRKTFYQRFFPLASTGVFLSPLRKSGKPIVKLLETKSLAFTDDRPLLWK